MDMEEWQQGGPRLPSLIHFLQLLGNFYNVVVWRVYLQCQSQFNHVDGGKAARQARF